MKKLTAILILLLLHAVTYSQAVVIKHKSATTVEYLRPTADATTSNTALKNALGFSGTALSSSSMSTVYAGKTGAPPTGASATQVANSIGTASRYKMRVLSTLQAPSSACATSATLQVSLSCSVSDTGDNTGGECAAAFSTNGGTTWSNLYSYPSYTTASDSQTTYSATITGATLSNVQIGVGAEGYTDTGSATITAYDAAVVCTH